MGPFILPFEQLPIAIDAAFVEFMHTRSLELRVWRGARDEWPRAGTACGSAKVALRPLLTTLDGVDGDVSVVPEGGRGSGNVACHLFFKHRGVGSIDANLEQRGGRARGSEERRVEHREPELVQEEVEALVAREGSSDADDSDALHGAGAVAASVRVLGLSASQSRTQEEVNAQPSEPEPSGGKLNVYVERAMRLLSSPGGSTEPGASPDVLPSTYVTFRWEEGGKPPLRSPLVLAPAAAGEADVGCGADVGNTEAWQVRLDSALRTRARIVSTLFGQNRSGWLGSFTQIRWNTSTISKIVFYYITSDIHRLWE